MWVHQQCFYHSVTSQSMVRLCCIYSEQFQFLKKNNNKEKIKTVISYNNVRHFPFKKSLWQRKINHNIKKKLLFTLSFYKNKQTNKKRDQDEEVTTDLVCGWKNGTEVQKVRNTRGVMVVHAHSTGLHCTMWSNHRKIFYHAQNANDVEPPKNNSGKACREYCKHCPLTPQVCKLL